MVRYRTCSVKGCGDIQSRRHQFPNPQKKLDIFNKWIEACGNEELNSLSIMEIYRRRKVCHIHFSKEHEMANKLLSPGAIPTLFVSINTDENLPSTSSISADVSSNTKFYYPENGPSDKRKVKMSDQVHELEQASKKHKNDQISEKSVWSEATNNRCRTCLQVPETPYNIFNHLENNKYVSDMLKEFATIQICQNDRLPVSICRGCLKKLTAAYRFKLQVIDSDTKLHCVYDNTQKEIENSSEEQNVVEMASVLIKMEDFDEFETPTDSEQSNTEYIIKPNETISKSDDTNVTTNNINIAAEEDDVVNVALKQEIDDFEAEDTEVMVIHSSDNEQFSLDEARNNEEATGTLVDSNIHSTLSNNSAKNDSEYLNPLKFLYKRCDYSENGRLEKHGYTMSTLFRRIELYKGKDEDSNSDNSTNHSENISNSEGNSTAHSKLVSVSQQELNNESRYIDRIICEPCKKTYHFEYFSKIHMQNRHESNCSFRCAACKKHFTQLSKYTRHLEYCRRYTFICNVCDKRFASLFILNRHKAFHTIATYVCQTCKRKFTKASAFQLHGKTHEKKHTCYVCNKSFKDEDICKAHLLTHDSIDTFPCPACSKVFSSKNDVTEHLKEHV